MTFAVLLLATAFTLLMLFKALEPFFAPRDEQLSLELIGEDLREVEALVAQRAALVLALRDLEYDWETDKVSDEDYKRFRRSYERQAVAAMRRLDAIHGGQDWHETIDEALNERLNAQPSSAATEDEPMPTSAPTTPESDQEESQLRCVKCSLPLASDDRFCSKCGAPASTASTTDDAEIPVEKTSPSDDTAMPISNKLTPPASPEVSQ